MHPVSPHPDPLPAYGERETCRHPFSSLPFITPSSRLLHHPLPSLFHPALVSLTISPASGSPSSAHSFSSRRSICSGLSTSAASLRNFASTSSSDIGFFQWPL